MAQRLASLGTKLVSKTTTGAVCKTHICTADTQRIVYNELVFLYLEPTICFPSSSQR